MGVNKPWPPVVESLHNLRVTALAPPDRAGHAPGGTARTPGADSHRPPGGGPPAAGTDLFDTFQWITAHLRHQEGQGHRGQRAGRHQGRGRSGRGVRRHRVQRAQPPGPGGRVDPHRVRRPSPSSGFIRNESARQLRAGRSRTIASWSWTWGTRSSPTWRTASRTQPRPGLAVMLCNSDEQQAKETTTSSCCPNSGCAGSW